MFKHNEIKCIDAELLPASDTSSSPNYSIDVVPVQTNNIACIQSMQEQVRQVLKTVQETNPELLEKVSQIHFTIPVALVYGQPQISKIDLK